MPVLAGLMLDASDDGLVLSTFDYEVSARVTLPADVTDAGQALVSGRLLADICRSLPAKPVEMTIDGAQVIVTCGSSRFSLQTMPVEDYPALPEMPGAPGTLRERRLRRRGRPGVTAAGRDDTLPVLTGVRLEIEADDHDAGDRPLPALPPRARLAPDSPDESLGRAGAGAGLGDTAKSLTAAAR